MPIFVAPKKERKIVRAVRKKMTRVTTAAAVATSRAIEFAVTPRRVGGNISQSP